MVPEPGCCINIGFCRGRFLLLEFVRQVLHGGALKLIALASRGLFLLLVAPHLLSGELGTYVFFSTVAILSARVLSLGLEEQLPLRIGGNHRDATFFSPITTVGFVVEAVLLLVWVAFPNKVVGAILLSVCMTVTSVFGGVLRSVHVAGSERLRDMHWPIFTGICLLPLLWKAEMLLAAMAGSMMIVQALELLFGPGKVTFISAQWKLLARELRYQVGKAWKKLLASSAILLQMRAVVLWPAILGLTADADTVAYGLLLGEAFCQTAMVLVYRRYSYYCRTVVSEADFKADATRNVLVLLGYAGIAALGVVLLRPLGIVVGSFSNWPTVSGFIIFFGCLAAYLLVRYLTWVMRDFDWRLVALEGCFVLAQGIVVLLVPGDFWVYGIALVAMLMLFAAWSYVTRFVHPAPKPITGGYDLEVEPRLT